MVENAQEEVSINKTANCDNRRAERGWSMAGSLALLGGPHKPLLAETKQSRKIRLQNVLDQRRR